jgi:hypothetical protein
MGRLEAALTGRAQPYLVAAWADPDRRQKRAMPQAQGRREFAHRAGPKIG